MVYICTQCWQQAHIFWWILLYIAGFLHVGFCTKCNSSCCTIGFGKRQWPSAVCIYRAPDKIKQQSENLNKLWDVLYSILCMGKQLTLPTYCSIAKPVWPVSDWRQKVWKGGGLKGNDQRAPKAPSLYKVYSYFFINTNLKEISMYAYGGGEGAGRSSLLLICTVCILIEAGVYF